MEIKENVQIGSHVSIYSDDTESLQTGLVAQEVEKIYPYVVRQPIEENGYKWVDYKALIPLMIKSIQELKAEIEELKAQINN